MSAIEIASSEWVVRKLRAARLRVTTARIAVLQGLQSDPDRWFHVEALYRTLGEHGVEVCLGALHQVMNEMVSRDLLLRRVDENGKRFFRLRPSDSALHRIVCRDTGRVLALTDDISPEYVASALRSLGLMLDGPITVQVRCTGGLSRAVRDRITTSPEQKE